MSIEAIVWARKLQLPPRDKFVLVALADYANDAWEAWPKQGTLADWTGYTRPTVNAALEALEKEHGVVRSEERRYSDGRNASKKYFLGGRVKRIDTDDSPVNAVDPAQVNAVDPDRVNAVYNKNPQHRTPNIEPSPPQSPPAAEPTLEEGQSPTGDVLSTRPYAKKAPPMKPAKAKRPSRSESQVVLDAYNAHRGTLPAAQVLNSSRERKIRRLILDLGSATEAASAMAVAAAEVANDPFWQKNKYGLDNLLNGQKVVQKAEAAVSRGTTDRKQADRDRLLAAIGAAS